MPTTLEALGHLRRLQIVRESDYRLLRSSYLFLRNVIDAFELFAAMPAFGTSRRIHRRIQVACTPYGLSGKRIE